MTPTPPDHDDTAEERWTLNVCIACGDAVMKGIGETARHARVCGQSRVLVEVVALARAEQAEQERDAIRDRYDEDVHDFWGLNDKARAAEARAESAERRLREVRAWLKHPRTT